MKKLLFIGLLAVLACTACDFVFHFDEEEGRAFFHRWEDYIDGNTLYRDIIRPGAHNAGAVECRLFGISPIQKLDCQSGSVYGQLTFGTRYLDIRLGKNPGDTISIVHGLGVSRISLEDALSDIASFHANYPDEIIEIDVIPYPASYIEFNTDDDKKIADILETHLPRSLVFLASDPIDINTATLAEMRASGKCYIVSSQWYSGVAHLDYTGTWSREYHQSDGVNSEEARKLYSYFRERLRDARPDERLVFATNRARDGESLPFALPFDYMMNDRPVLDDFFDWITEGGNIASLAKVHGFDGDFVSYDAWFCARTILLNLARGSVISGHEEEFENEIKKALD